MSFLKFWKGKKPDDGLTSGSESSPISPTLAAGSYRRSSTGTSSDTSLPVSPPPEEENRKSARKLSISRSGRYRAKKRERSIISDKPEVFQYPTSPAESIGSTTSSRTCENDWTERAPETEGTSPVHIAITSRTNTNSLSNIRNVNEPMSSFILNHPQNYASQATAV